MCIFRYLYLENPKNRIGDIQVGRFRYELGYEFAREMSGTWQEIVDCVVPIPETGKTYAMGMADALQKPYCEALVKNNDIRCLCFEETSKRNEFLEKYLNVIRGKAENKNILLTDEAVLTGTTLKKAVKKLKEAGAKSIIVAVPSPVSNCRCKKGVMEHLNSIYSNMSPEEYADMLQIKQLKHIEGELFLKILKRKHIDACTECFDFIEIKNNGLKESENYGRYESKTIASQSLCV